jgi:hypothetical protein
MFVNVFFSFVSKKRVEWRYNSGDNIVVLKIKHIVFICTSWNIPYQHCELFVCMHPQVCACVYPHHMRMFPAVNICVL